MNKQNSKTKKYIWIALGVILLALVFSREISQGVAKSRAKGLVTAVQAVLPESSPASTYDATAPLEADGAVINNIPVMGELLVPTLDVDVALIEEYNKKNLRQSPCIISGTIADGNLIVAGGNYRSHFGKLNSLTKGDTVMLCDFSGNLYLYDVELLEFADKENELSISDGGYDLSLYCVTPGGSPRYVARCGRCE